MGDNDRNLEDIAKSSTEDFYELLGVSFDTDAKDINRQYRKVSIKYHPDKNPDDAGANDRFIHLGWARDILCDARLKSLYDTTRLRKKERALQDELLDGRRRKMKEDLERRERDGSNFKRKRADDVTDAERREMEIQRLAEDGKRRRREQQEKLERQRNEEEASFMEMSPEVETKPQAPGQSAEIDRTVKVRFVREGEAAAWDKEQVTAMFSKYGKVDSVVMGKDKKIRLEGEKHKKVVALVFIVYTRLDHAHAAVSDAKTDHPLLETVAWASKEPDIKSPAHADSSAPSTPTTTPHKPFRTSFGASLGSRGFGGSVPGTPSFSFSPKTPSLEEVTMIRLKQAEKKRLEEQIRKQEAAEEAAA